MARQGRVEEKDRLWKKQRVTTVIGRHRSEVKDSCWRGVGKRDRAVDGSGRARKLDSPLDMSVEGTGPSMEGAGPRIKPSKKGPGREEQDRPWRGLGRETGQSIKGAWQRNRRLSFLF